MDLATPTPFPTYSLGKIAGGGYGDDGDAPTVATYASDDNLPALLRVMVAIQGAEP